MLSLLLCGAQFDSAHAVECMQHTQSRRDRSCQVTTAIAITPGHRAISIDRSYACIVCMHAYIYIYIYLHIVPGTPVVLVGLGT